jgi:dienelactone hydrolase
VAARAKTAWYKTAMVNVVLFHSIYGRRPAVIAAADRLRDYGHTVETPDLYEGAVFDSLEAAQQYQESRGLDLLLSRAWSAMEDLPTELVYSGFSMGSAIAEEILLARPGAVAALLFSGAIPVDEIGTEAWPLMVPAEVHYAAGDPFVEQWEVDGLQQDVTSSGGAFTAFSYAGAGHLFADPGLPDYDGESAELMWQRAGEFLARL